MSDTSLNIIKPVFVSDNTVTVKAPAKINLTLDVTGKREDGYHLLQMVMQTVDLCDELVISMNTSGNVTLKTSPELPGLRPDDNLVYRAVMAMKERYNIHSGFDINLRKSIPSAAGLAGGSSDCAAALRAVRALMERSSDSGRSNHISDNELCDIGVTLGADVPFCVAGGTVLCEGIGEVLTPLQSLEKMPVLIVKPDVSVPTVSVYKKLDRINVTRRPDNKSMLKAIDSGDLEDISRYLSNVLELVTIPENPVIENIKHDIKNAGAMNALMSGSGPSVFGIFSSFTEAEKASEKLKSKYPEAFVHACRCI